MIPRNERNQVVVTTSVPFMVVFHRDANEFLASFDEVMRRGPPFDMQYLKDRDREMILLLLDNVATTNDAKYIPVLEAW